MLSALVLNGTKSANLLFKQTYTRVSMVFAFAVQCDQLLRGLRCQQPAGETPRAVLSFYN